MKYFFVIPIATVVASLLLVAVPALGGGIRGSNNSNKNKDTNDLVVISNEEIRRILQEDATNNVPIVSENCTDTVGLVEVSFNATLNCRKIKRSKLCDR